MSETCDWKVVYQTLEEAEDGYHRTPSTPSRERPGTLLPYWCDEHKGYHLGHFCTLGQRAYRSWGAALYNTVNAYARRRRKEANRRPKA